MTTLTSRRAAGPSVRTPASSVRLTRRGRVLVVLLLVAILVGMSVLVAARSAATGRTGPPVPTRTVVVSEGDTLWDIADAVAGPGEIPRVVNQIETLNSLPGPQLVEGQELAVPVG